LKYPLCQADQPFRIGDSHCDQVYNIATCLHDHGDCCIVPNPRMLGDKICDAIGFEDGIGPYNTPSCNYVYNTMKDALYLNCMVQNASLVGDGECNGIPYNSLEYKFDGGDYTT